MPDVKVDADRDGYAAGIDDCDDRHADVNPTAIEICDGVDNDCDGEIDGADAADATIYYPDEDGDGWGNDASPIPSCEALTDVVLEGGDCDDGDAASYPGASEVCDGEDNDCDGAADEDFDVDGDGYAGCWDDCNDASVLIYPGAPESCLDIVDSDCDGSIEDGDDLDGDGYTDCEGDCNDSNADINPDAVEICDDGIDNDCDGVNAGSVDNDGDGYSACDGDCDDTDPAISPAAAEVCDLVDNNCDGAVDEGSDADGDGATSCGGDCDDGDASVYPEAEERCDGVDQNCNGLVDEGAATAYYPDRDGDGFGDAASPPEESCEPVEGKLADDSDCNDEDPDINPDAREVCDVLDNDCNGLTDDAFWEGQPLSGVCGIHVLRPVHQSIGLSGAYPLIIDFDSSDVTSEEQPLRLVDPEHLWITLQDDTGTVWLDDPEHNDFGDPEIDEELPTRVRWSTEMIVEEGRSYTLTVQVCEKGCAAEEPGWIIMARSVFSSERPCGTVFDIKNGLEITSYGDTAQWVLDFMNADIQNSAYELALFLLDVPDTASFPLTPLSAGFGPLDPPEPYSVSRDWGVPTLVPNAAVDSSGAFETPRTDMALAVPMTAGVFMLYVQDALQSATVSSVDGKISTMSDYRLTGYVSEADTHKMLVDAGLEFAEEFIVYDNDRDGDGVPESAAVVINATPQLLSEVSGLSDSCF